MTDEIKKEQPNVRSFRVTDDVMSRFNGIKDELKLNQDAALAMLINAYELEQAKEVLPDRETEIANFQMKAKELVDAFLFSLQLNQDAEERVRCEVALKVETLEKALAKYQEELAGERDKVRTLQAEKNALEALSYEVEALKGELAEAKEEQDEAKALHEKQLSDKEEIISMLQEKLGAAEDKANGYDALKEEKDALGTQLTVAQEALKDQKNDFERQAERAAYEAEKAQNKAVEAVKAEMAQKIDELKERLQQAQIDAEHQLRVIEKESSAEIRGMEQELRKAEQENARLREKIANLEAKEEASKQKDQ